MKTREEIIKKAQELLDCGALSKDACDAIKADFPELAESEDERIRKSIIAFLQAQRYVPNNQADMLNGWIAYLEKQKEQKPAEWSLTDATFIEEIDETLFMAETGRNEVVKNQIESERNFLKSLPERFNLQPKQEWSEEDKKMMIRVFVAYDALRSYIEDNEISSEKYKNYQIKMLEGEVCWLKNWFKSLRPQPHWKPSEEQMGALSYAYCELFKREDVGHNILGPLQNLINTLSKL